MTEIKEGVKKEVIQGLASGQSQLDLSKRTGVTHQAISHFKNKAEIKSLIEKETEKFYKKLTRHG